MPSGISRKLRAIEARGPALEDGDRMPGARWFPGARLNFAENLLRGPDADPAIVFRSENGGRRELAWRELRAEVARIAAGLRADGVGPGDVVAAFLPNLPEAVIAMLAAASIGATFTSCSPDFGIAGVLDRFGQVKPKVLFTADGYFYAGKTHRFAGADRRRAAGTARPSGAWSSWTTSMRRMPRRGCPAPWASPTTASAVQRRALHACRSSTRSTCSTRAARPACRNASSTAPAARCSST